MSEPDATSSGASPSGAVGERIFAGRYRLSTRRGTGVDIALFEGIDTLDDRPVAVKIIHPDICARPGFEDRFAETMHLVGKARHPNVQQLVDFGSATWQGHVVHYAVCENLTGGSVRDLRARGRQLSPSQAVMVGLDVCRALDVAHRVGLVHSDVRPANLVFGDDGKVRVTDLGLASLVSEGLWADPGRVSVDRARYASPEQAQNRPIGPKSDVYSLCLTLLEAVTGQVPFVGDSTVATLANRVDRLLPVSADLGPLAAVFERAARPDATDRSSAAEFGRAMVQAAERLPRPAPIPLISAGLFAEAPPVPEAPAMVLAPADPTLAMTVPDAAAPTIAMALPASGVPVTAVAPAAPEPPAAPPSAPIAAPAPTQPMTSAAPATAPVVDPTAVVPVTGHAVPPPPPPDQSVPILRERRSRRKLLAVVAIVVVALAAGGALAWFLGRDTAHTVPDVVGLAQGEALNEVSEFGWNVVITEEPSDTVPVGDVIRTEPIAGASLKEQAAFTIVVSTGPAPRVLPELNGLTVEQATAALLDLDLVLEVGGQVNDETVPAGTVVSWSVPSVPGLAAGDTVVPGTAVVVQVSSGPAPRIVDDLTGLALADATAVLAANDLVVAQLPDEFSPDVPVGGIVRQDPPPGTPLERGSTVSVAVSKGPDLVPVPPLAGLSPAEATSALEAAGLAVGVVKGDPAGVNVLAEVNGASIGAGASFPRGTAIDLSFEVPPPPTTLPPETTTTVPV
jgi:beta-lactam-binding protein with PASTA domain